MSTRITLAACCVAAAMAVACIGAGDGMGGVISGLGQPALRYRKHEVLVKFGAGVPADAARALADSQGCRVEARLATLSRLRKRTYLLLRSEQVSAPALLATLRALPQVEAASLNYARRICAPALPDDPDFGELWGLHNTGQSVSGVAGTPDADIDAPEAWEITAGSPDVVVAVIDTGVDYLHPDLAANMWVNPGETPGNGLDDDGNGYVDDVHGFDFAGDIWGRNDSDPMDDDGHGTHIAGTIAAVSGNGIGVAGLAWNARIMALKNARPPLGFLMDADSIEAIAYATLMKRDYGINVVAINASWGGFGGNDIMREVIRAAGNAGIVFCAAAGNESNNNDGYQRLEPASTDLPNIIAVAASDAFDEMPDFSNFGFGSVDLAAPGMNIRSTIPRGEATTATLDAAGTPYDARPMAGAGRTGPGGVTGTLYDCGAGTALSFPPGVDGNIALIRRGDTTFLEKTWWAQRAGAAAAVIYNNETGTFEGTLGFPGDWIPVVSISKADGAALLALGNIPATVVNSAGGAEAYATWEGTSMATPHVAGAVALAAAAYPDEDVHRRVNRILSGVDRPASLAGKVATEGRLNVANAIAPDLEFHPFVTSQPTLIYVHPTGIALIGIQGTGFGTDMGTLSLVRPSGKSTPAHPIAWDDGNVTAIAFLLGGTHLRLTTADGRSSNVKSLY